MGLWNRMVDGKVFLKPPTALETLALAGAPSPLSLHTRLSRIPSTGEPWGRFLIHVLWLFKSGLYLGPAFLLWASLKSSRWSGVLIDVSPLTPATMFLASLSLQTRTELSVRGTERQGEYSIQEKRCPSPEIMALLFEIQMPHQIQLVWEMHSIFFLAVQ